MKSEPKQTDERDRLSAAVHALILARRDNAGVQLITREVCMSDPARVQG
jgi:hypothetical protein